MEEREGVQTRWREEEGGLIGEFDPVFTAGESVARHRWWPLVSRGSHSETIGLMAGPARYLGVVRLRRLERHRARRVHLDNPGVFRISRCLRLGGDRSVRLCDRRPYLEGECPGDTQLAARERRSPRVQRLNSHRGALFLCPARRVLRGPTYHVTLLKDTFTG